jgi:hypothetical protein
MEFGNFGYVDELTAAGWGDGWKKAKQKQNLPDSEKPRFHWHMDDPGVVPTLLVTGAGSPTGITVYEGNLLPKKFQNQVIHCDAGPKVVRAYPVTPSGAGYKATTENLLTSADDWFRPSDVCVAPDGSVLVADWNDPGVGGHNMGDRDLATMRGRVYRLAPVAHRYSVPKLDLKTVDGCVAALKSPNMATRYLAWVELNKSQEKAEDALARLWNDSDPRLRARALHLLARIKGRAEKYVTAAINDRDADIRVTGLRIGRSLQMDAIPLVKELVNDPSAQVRRECAIALRHNESNEAPALWTRLAQQHDGKDRWYLEALGIGADKQEDRFFSAWLTAVGSRWNTPVGHDIIWRSRSPKAAALLAKIVTSKDVPEAEKARYMRALDYIKGPEKEAALAEIATSALN